mmetsp:Transcript_15842/g.23850  ORF Transcript_15842/g.23850 Transcript_15842/m.23850 type:complete len:231 (-) Transcript_15842:87-779(-)|eukprot:CAMPEP_0185019682 /NCGR_PEP_ID=MMETSP1103-20130426/2301_1 /TAXON_ID=36769 /ORGANISM="Paraphysomonas bandaiensis, Strain Caron Lab Isolate" /LENGTH=230 /DNA_ID=CAMNT_0027550135 /DNA_START=56 /DNA_END=748 /DNA_ORIENTATION=-
MADDEESGCKVEYIDTPDGTPEETNWIMRAGRARVTYPNGCTFEGTFDAERIKQGPGVFVWMKAGEEDEGPIEKARYEGNYKDGARNGVGKMTYPNGDIYEGEWLDNKMHGEGTYIYKKTGDIYSGSWAANAKNGEGRYEFGGDSSVLVGHWQNGQINKGTWELKGAGKYDGEFKLGRPIGDGRFEFLNGITQEGEYVESKDENEDDAADEAEAPSAPNVSWKGQPIVSF